jgi:hypothetical protein
VHVGDFRRRAVSVDGRRIHGGRICISSRWGRIRRRIGIIEKIERVVVFVFACRIESDADANPVKVAKGRGVAQL